MRERAESGLGSGIARYTRDHKRWQAKIRVIEHIEKLRFNAKLEPFADHKPLGQVKVARDEIRTP